MGKKECFKKIIGNPYNQTAFYWALMYKPSGPARPHIVRLCPRYEEVRRMVRENNDDWEKNGFGKEWSSKRFELS